TMDQQLFNIARPKAVMDLNGAPNANLAGLATCIFMLGWATGGIIFGILGDRYGRAKTMTVTILLYSLFTGLSAFSIGIWDFAFYRFLTGLGVGGEFAVGVTLVAEVMPQRARAHALAWLQACSAFGNITAAFVGLAFSQLSDGGLWRSLFGGISAWRIMFIVGAIPAFLAIFITRRLREPEAWQTMRDQKEVRLGSYSELFGDPRWRRNAIGGVLLATSGVVGLWGIGFFGFDLVTAIFRQTFEKQAISQGEDKFDRQLVQRLLRNPSELAGVKESITSPNSLVAPEAKLFYKAMLSLRHDEKPIAVAAVLHWTDENQGSTVPSARFTRKQLEDFAGPTPDQAPVEFEIVEHISHRGKEIESRLLFWGAMYGLLFNGGAFFGIHFYRRLSQAIGRRGAFAISFVAAMFTTAFVFWFLESFVDVCWMVPIMGFFQLAIFGGYAIYFPELFPTRLRSTGTSFCYNVGRYLAAAGPLTLGLLASKIFGNYGEAMSWRYAGVCMCSFYLLGLMALPFLPETKDKPLPV
ncbi:MAG TPA: MFS transporter, partial [Gemmataceae bacterium]|nr:MFS transporter [Gemmataceae bacterium]